MSSSTPAEVSFSLDEFSKHGGLTDKHKDGWGIAYYNDNDARIIKEACSASESTYLKFIKTLKIQSKIIISHIRLATQGEVSVRNTQPFSRELGGKRHVFVHNGNFVGLDKQLATIPKRFKSIGNTDSELSFCYLMEKMAIIWDTESTPNLANRLQVFTAFCNEMRRYGIANFIYSDSDYTFIHSHKRLVKADMKTTSAGLHILHRNCPTQTSSSNINGLQIKTDKPQHVIIVASVPLSNENWEALQEGEIKVLQNGMIVTS
jgi:glutamine amidotransferase